MELRKVELLLGTNLGKREENLRLAIKNISNEVGEIIYKSQVLETEPIGFTSSNLFLNQSIQIKTSLSPISLLRSLKEIEKKMGRVYLKPEKGESYTSRLIDIDILNYDNIVFKSDKLSLPHHQITSRSFVKSLMIGQNS